MIINSYPVATTRYVLKTDGQRHYVPYNDRYKHGSNCENNLEGNGNPFNL